MDQYPEVIHILYKGLHKNKIQGIRMSILEVKTSVTVLVTAQFFEDVSSVSLREYISVWLVLIVEEINLMSIVTGDVTR